jgi:hypothetical protein
VKRAKRNTLVTLFVVAGCASSPPLRPRAPAPLAPAARPAATPLRPAPLPVDRPEPVVEPEPLPGIHSFVAHVLTTLARDGETFDGSFTASARDECLALEIYDHGLRVHARRLLAAAGFNSLAGRFGGAQPITHLAIANLAAIEARLSLRQRPQPMCDPMPGSPCGARDPAPDPPPRAVAAMANALRGGGTSSTLEMVGTVVAAHSDQAVRGVRDADASRVELIERVLAVAKRGGRCH